MLSDWFQRNRATTVLVCVCVCAGKKGVFPQILQKVDLHIVSLEECRKAYGHYTVMEDCMICAGFKEGGKSTCYVSCQMVAKLSSTG